MIVQELERTNHIINTKEMKIWVTNTAVEIDPSANTFKENLNRRRGVLSLGAPLLICLLNVSLQPWIIQYNNRTPSDQIIRITIISIKGWYKQNNNNPDYKDTKTKQGSSDSYRETTLSIAKCNKSEWNFAESWGRWHDSTY